MKAAIIGHGPSLLERGLGSKIDSYDVVIRLKRCAHLLKHPETYGTRVDAVCGSWTLGTSLKEVASPNYWIFCDSRHEGVTLEQIHAMKNAFSPAMCYIDPHLCNFWNKIYRDNRDIWPVEKMTERKGMLSDDKGHLHMSAGLHAVLYAMEVLEPTELHLLGFDNLMQGKQATWSVTRGPDWQKFPDHNWGAELKTLGEMVEHYNQVVTCL